MTNLGAKIRDTMRQHESAVYEAGDSSLSPWPEDPDMGTLRYAGAIRAVLGVCDEISTNLEGEPSLMGETIATAFLVAVADALGIPTGDDHE